MKTKSRSEAASIASNARTHASRVAGGKKAAQTREQRHPGSLAEAGRKGGRNSRRQAKAN